MPARDINCPGPRSPARPRPLDPMIIAIVDDSPWAFLRVRALFKRLTQNIRRAACRLRDHALPARGPSTFNES